MDIDDVTGTEHAAFWATHLKGELPVATFPVDYDRPPVSSFMRAQETATLTSEAAAAIQRLIGERESSELVLFLTATTIALSRYADSEELVIGAVAASANGDATTAGSPKNVRPVAIRLDLSGDSSVADYLRTTDEILRSIAAHAQCDYRTAVPDRDRPPFNVLCHVTGVETPLVPAGAGDAADGAIETAVMDADLCAILTVADDAAWEVTFDYDSELYRPETIERVLGHVVRALEAITADVSVPISRLDLIQPAERELVLRTWNATERDYPLDRCLPEWIDDQIQRSPHAPAVTFEGVTIDYAELGRRTDALVRLLHARGVGPESLVGVAMERSFELVVALLGVLKAGAAYVPLDPSYPAERIGMMVEDSGLRLALTHDRVTMDLPGSVETLAIDRLEPRDDASDAVGMPAATPDNAAYVIFTSGSTGRPKGVANTHTGICNRLLWMQEMYELTAADVVLQKTPFSFDVSVWEFFWPLMVGARLVVARPDGHRDSAYLRSLIQSEAVTIVHFVPSMLRLFLEEKDLRESCASLRHVIASGEALTHELQEQFLGKVDAQLHNLYGPTEAAVDVTSWACERYGDRSVVPIGRPVANTQIFVLDRYQRPVPPGVPGELYIGGVQVARGYVNRPELTAERFMTSSVGDRSVRLYRTGDRVRWLADGAIEYLGRMDHQVKIRGFRIELGEIEAVLVATAGVHQGVVVVRAGPAGDDQLVAYVVTERGVQTTPENLRERLASRLAPYMVPTHMVFLDALPLLPNGKVDRKGLPAPTPRRPETDDSASETQTGTEQTIAKVWCEFLGIDRVGVHDNFFELGGDSLLSMRVASALQETLGVPMPVVTIFEAPTVRKLAAHVDRGRGRSLEVDDIQKRAQRQRMQFTRPRPMNRP